MTREKHMPAAELLRPLPAPSSHPTPTGPGEGLLAGRGLGKNPDPKAPADAPFDERLDSAWTKWGSV